MSQLISDLPAWVPAEAWAEFVKMRKTIKKPLTEYAARLVIKKLAKLAQAGHDPQEVLDQSIEQCWQGIFPVKQDAIPRALPSRPAPGHGPRLALVDQNQANTAAAKALLGFSDEDQDYAAG